MPIDSEHYNGPATRGDAGRIGIKVVLALGAIADALEIVAGDRDISEQLTTVRAMAREIEDHWNTLASWTDK